MGDTGNFADPATFSGPPAGPPTQPGGSGLIHENELSNPVQMLHEDDIGQSIPNPQPAAAAQPQMVHEDDLQPKGSTLSDKAQNFSKSVAPPAVAEAMQNPAGNGNIGRSAGSLVSKIMAPLDKVSYPIRMSMMGVVAAGSAAGIPGFQDLYKRLNPNNEYFPDPHFHDVTDFLWDKASEGNQMGAFGRAMISTGKVVSGAVADMATDPLMYMGIGELSEGAKALQKIGDYSDIAKATAKEALTFGSPLSADKKVLISGESAGKAYQAIKNAPIVGPVIQTGQDALTKMGQVVRWLSPNTGYADVDYAANRWAALNKGQDSAEMENFISRISDKGYSPDEAKLVGELGESVPNHVPNLPPDVLKGAKSKFADEASIRAQVSQQMPDLAKKLGMSVDPARAETIADGVIEAKRMDAKFLETQYQSGHLTSENIGQRVLENHLPHVMDPKYYGNAEAQKIYGKVSGFDVGGKERQMQGTVSELNEMIANKYGMKNFFIEDPFVSTAMRQARAQKLLRDTQLLDAIKHYGVAETAESRNAGMLPIRHPELSPEIIHPEKLYPKDIATKMSYLMGTQSPGNIMGSVGEIATALNQSLLGKQNRLLRTQVFTAPGIWARNAIDNLGKAAIFGTGKDAWGKTFDILGGSFKGELSASNLLHPNGKFYSGEELRKLLQDYGITRGTSWREGMGNYLSASKQSILDQSGNPLSYVKRAGDFANGAMNFVAKYGEKAESFSRASMFVQKVLHEGYEPAAAADLVTRVMFDYTRNSPLTDAARFFMPFIQHPIKTALAAPMLIGKNPGYYNAIHNTFQSVLSNAMADPMHREMFNQLAPDWIKGRDAIAGPLIPGDSWLANLFGKNVQSYFTPDIGMSILNTFAHPGLSPTLEAVKHLITGKNQFGVPIPESQRGNAFIWDTIRGTVSMPNTERIIKQAFGLGNPDLYQPLTVHLMRAATSQFMGSIELEREAHYKLISLGYAYKALQKEGSQILRKEAQGLGSPNSYTTYLNEKYGPVIPATNAQVYFDTMSKNKQGLNQISGEQQKTALAQAFAGNQMDAGKYRALLINVENNIDQVNKSLQFGYQRYLDMSKGAKTPQEARAKAGVKMLSEDQIK